MAVNWTNNPNDGQSTDIATAGLSGTHTGSTTTLFLSSFELTDGDGVGHANWKVGDSLTVTGSASTLYGITAIAGHGSDEAVVTIDTGLVETIISGVVINKEGSYAGNQGSAANHVRLRNQGQI